MAFGCSNYVSGC